MKSNFELLDGTQEFLQYLRGLDVHLRADGDKLRVDAPRGILTPDLQAEIASRKPGLLAFLSQARAAENLLPPVEPVPRLGPLPLSVSQERIGSLAALFPESSLYNMYLAFRLDGPLDAAALEGSIAGVVRRHEILRTVFETHDGRPVQRIRPFEGWSLPVAALPENGEGGPGPGAVQRWVSGEVERPFDLGKGPLLRAHLLRLGGASHVLVLVMHHILSDGWSWDIFLKEITAIYSSSQAGAASISGAASTSGAPSPLPELPVQYADFAVWQQELVGGPKLRPQAEYWQEQLGGPVAELALPYDHPPTQSYAGARLSRQLPPHLSDRLRDLSRAAGSTPFITLLAGFYALLYNCTGQEDLLVCTPVACRTRPETQDLIGYFNNLLPLRASLSAQLTFLGLVEQVHRVALEAYERQDLPFHRLMELPGLERLSLTRAVFALQTGAGRSFELPGLQVTPLEVYNGAANFDLFFVVEERDGALHCVLEYKTARFEAGTMAGLLEDYASLLEEVSAGPQRPLSAFLTRAAAGRPAPPAPPQAAPQSSSPGFVAPGTLIEKQLARIWEETLGVQPIGVKDSFFALGGGSLLALKTFNRIESQLGASLPLAALLQNPTIEHLAGLIGAPSTSVSWASLVPIQPFGAKPPFFGVHGLHGNVLFWRGIVEHLGLDQPFYALQAQGMDGLQPALGSIPAMAAHYIGEIREVQPHGPYYLGGYSLGGEIAFEMAHQLLAAGEKVALLVLFDTSNPVRPVRPAAVPPAAGGDRARVGAAGGKLPELRRKLRNHLRILSGKSPKQKLVYLWKDARMRGRRLAVKAAVHYYRRRGLRLPEALREQYLLESHVIAVMEYVPRVYPGRITLFRASQSLPGNPIDDPMGWGPLAAGGIDLHIFDSTHVIVSERFSKDVAAVLKACLAQARAEP